jgi:hypothetical protein
VDNIFYVKEYIKSNMTDSESIELCLAEASKVHGEKQVVFDGKDYHIDRAILVDSDTTIVIDNCSVKQNDFVFDNVFRGKNVLLSAVNPYMAPLEVTPLRNVKIIGKLIDDYFTGDLWHDGSFIALVLLLFMFLVTYLTGGFSAEEQTETRGTSLW